MAGRRVYSDKDRAAAYAELTVNGGNVKRTARTLGIPHPTITRWKQEWARTGVPSEVTVEVPKVSEDFLTNAIRTRDKLLIRLEQMVDDGDVNARDVTTALGVLTDKIRAYQNIPSQKVEHTFQLPPPEEIRALFAGAVEGVVTAAKVRAAEIESGDEPIDAEFTPLELEPAR